MTTIADDFDFIIQPGWRGSAADHWQSHWEQRLQAIRVENANWEQPDLDSWLAGLDQALSRARRPAIVIAHSLGCITVAHYARRHPSRIAGALLVAPADVERPSVPCELMPFAPLPRQPLPFASRVGWPATTTRSANQPAPPAWPVTGKARSPGCGRPAISTWHQVISSGKKAWPCCRPSWSVHAPAAALPPDARQGNCLQRKVIKAALTTLSGGVTLPALCSLMPFPKRMSHVCC